MIIGVPAEVKSGEHRVALTPDAVRELVEAGHDVRIEAGAGAGSSFPDADYESAGAVLCDASDAWAAELVTKVKEPQPSEHDYLRPGLILFTYLHLAATRECTEALVESGCTAIAYETVESPDGALPLLAPMSLIAGRLATQVGAWALQKANGGRGVLLGGIAGAPLADVVVLGAGAAGSQAVDVAVGMGAHVTVLDVSTTPLRGLVARYGNRVRTVTATAGAVDAAVLAADLVIGAVLVRGARAPRLVTNDVVARMRRGSVLVDIAVDQGGCFEDTRPTTHDAPLYSVHGSRFYAVANMPAAVPRTSTFALVDATLPYIKAIAQLGWQAACREDEGLAAGVNITEGRITCEPVARAHGMRHAPLDLGTA
ncbi:alanine dehydrogenase [Hoyosella sp. G463]|uniref:Alanine dehydrogenase n=1 Tax=Lolliginicoccus lacisalsi TaxID=2742202 RepID=A0A927PLU3_9ACTN|nr:alanine dehydrogenase [Lolliginicoccus lacisalsi]